MSGRQVSTQTRTIRSQAPDGTMTVKVIKTITTTENGKTSTEEIVEETTGLESDFDSAMNLSASKPSKDEKKGSSKPIPAADFQKQCLDKHNEYRRKHGVPPLKLSKDLCKYANEWVVGLAKKDTMEHREDHKYGENIFMTWTSDSSFQLTGDKAVESWYAEIKDHTFGKEPTTLASGHFTQVIWKASTEMGVATAKSASGKHIVVANYNPAGNFVGKFTENVPPPK